MGAIPWLHKIFLVELLDILNYLVVDIVKSFPLVKRDEHRIVRQIYDVLVQ